MLRWKPHIPAVAVLCIVAAIVIPLVRAAGSDANRATGVRFLLTMESPRQDDVVFSGAALGDNSSLTGRVGGIENVTLLTGGELYVLTPAIETARRIENPDPPGIEEEGWPEWLLEPGRVSPLTFARVLGEAEDVDGHVRFSGGDRVEARFDEGRLTRLRFPSTSGRGNIVYAYSDFEDDPDLTSNDFRVPPDYRMTD